MLESIPTGFARAHAATSRTMQQQKTSVTLMQYESMDYGKIAEFFCKTLKNNIFMHIDIVEVVDSSSTTPTSLRKSGRIPCRIFFTAGQAVRDQRRIDKTETGEAREGCPAVALAEADQTIGG